MTFRTQLKSTKTVLLLLMSQNIKKYHAMINNRNKITYKIIRDGVTGPDKLEFSGGWV